MLTVIHKRKSKLPTGTVQVVRGDDAVTVGWAVLRSRDAAGTYTQPGGPFRAPFWTATPWRPGGGYPEGTASGGLGTRYPSRAAAVAALRAFEAAYPIAARMEAWEADGDPNPCVYNRLLNHDLAAFLRAYKRGF